MEAGGGGEGGREGWRNGGVDGRDGEQEGRTGGGTRAKLFIYTTKIDGVVCPPNISETVAGRLMKLAHRQRITSTTIQLISKKITVHFINFLKTFQRIVADQGSGKTIQPIRI